jgi:hypothetical protein
MKGAPVAFYGGVASGRSNWVWYGGATWQRSGVGSRRGLGQRQLAGRCLRPAVTGGRQLWHAARAHAHLDKGGRELTSGPVLQCRQGEIGLKQLEIQTIQIPSKFSKTLTDPKMIFPCAEKLK